MGSGSSIAADKWMGPRRYNSAIWLEQTAVFCDAACIGVGSMREAGCQNSFMAIGVYGVMIPGGTVIKPWLEDVTASLICTGLDLTSGTWTG